MTDDMSDFFSDFKNHMGQAQKEIPDTLEAFGQVFEESMSDGELTQAEKEAVALGIAMAKQCKECVRLHTQKCLDAGLSRQQIMEAAGVAVMMNGGPSYAQLPELIKALNGLDGDE